ncbi:DUF6152 family protein [Geminicoccus flavidas]|uniref:DUF6152 family protein n=1 Tax=Geminicoccus flavidas TaxID=2506407 RepID=UPI001F198DB7|nr:DUF6152 family protein [Geminicoccus flavidas]
MSLFIGMTKCNFVLAALTAGAFLAAGHPAMAHHGWSWAQGEQMTLKGTIQSISMSPPHPTLQVEDAEGVVWQVDLGNPRQTERSGFTGDTAGPGDAITVLGNRSKDPDDMHMKAVRITIDGQNYDMYPERIQD